MKIQCPNCHSRATEKLSAAYAKGTRVSGSNVSHSTWATRCAPPEPKTVVGSLGFALLFVSLTVAPWVVEFDDGFSLDWDLLLTPYFAGLALVGIACLVGIVVRFVVMLHHLYYHFDDEYSLWERQWICRDCAEKFIPELPFGG